MGQSGAAPIETTSRELAPTARLRHHVVWFGVALVALILGADAYDGWQSYRVALEGSQQTIGLLSRAFSDQTARMVQELDFALTDFSEWNARADGTVASPDIVREQLLTHIARLPYVHSAAVFDADGRRRASTEANPPVGGNIAAHPVFSVPQHSVANVLYIGTPRVARSDGYRTFAVSRRLVTADGRFAGVIAVRVAFEYLARFYAAVDISPGAEIRLLRADGADLARYPGTAEPNPAAVPSPTARPAQQIVASQAVAGYPLLVEVSQPRSRALAAWRQKELASAARMIALAVLAGLLLGALAKSVRRLEEAEAARRSSEAQLQEARKAEAISLLAASVAHDFNNVLSAIVGYGELARAESEAGSPVHSKLDRLLAAAERARQLVRRVLTFDTSRVVQYGDVSLVPVVFEVLDQLQATLPARVKVESSLPEGPVAVRGDATEIHQVVMNLCTNAVHAMPNGGTLSVQLSPTIIAASRRCAVGELVPGEWLGLSIVDQGVGMGTDVIAHLFEPLRTSNPIAPGTGIGLSVVRNIVSNMHGAVDVQSTPGAGSKFTVYWPRARIGKDVHGPGATGAVRRPGGGQTILMVDDEPQLVMLLEELTASLGYEPVGFSDPQRALAAVRENPQRFDAVITDERMPVLRGTALAQALRELRAGLPVILVTAYRTADLDREARRCGVVHILDKPLRLNELARALSEVFGPAQVGATNAPD